LNFLSEKTTCIAVYQRAHYVKVYLHALKESGLHRPYRRADVALRFAPMSLRVAADTYYVMACPRCDPEAVRQATLSKSLISESMETLSMKFPAVACAAACAR
jgi:hypothetical protein